ncbi:MAG: hypothetical protein ACRDJC_20505, partial [Thermomicrobiales bacterium]
WNRAPSTWVDVAGAVTHCSKQKRRCAMIDHEEPWHSSFTVTPWTTEGIATIEATGGHVHAALEAGLGAVLELALESAAVPLGSPHSAPVRGEGDDVAELFAEMVEDLLDQIAYFGNGLHDVVVDGVLRRDGGGYVAWGYAVGTYEATAAVKPPELIGHPTATETKDGIVIRATFRRA